MSAEKVAQIATTSTLQNYEIFPKRTTLRGDIVRAE